MCHQSAQMGSRAADFNRAGKTVRDKTEPEEVAG
jgi:hypothetical protein